MDLKVLKGVATEREEELNKMGYFSTGDLIKNFPKRYLDLTLRQPLKFAFDNDMVLTVGKLITPPQNVFNARRKFVKVYCEQEGLYFTAIWFNQPYVAKKLTAGEEYLFYGRVKKNFDEYTLYNPSFEPLDKNYRLKGIVPQYAVKGNFPQKLMRDVTRLSVNLEKPQSYIPFPLQKKYDLKDLFWAYKSVHNPEKAEEIEPASERIAVEEYFALISAFKIVKGDREQVRINRYSCERSDIDEFIKSFPFEFTDGQKKAVDEIFADLKGKTVMNRLLQGDVGSGKTAVAAVTVFAAVKSGYQVAVLSPTEVLARQNHKVLSGFLKNANVGLLTGSMTAKEKSQIKKDVKDGKIDVLVGTHAVIESSVEFNSLALCVCDEQQRFGVAQRSALLSKGECPDLLVMSATPIPRTLSLIFFGDLDISTIADKPKNRKPVQTNFVSEAKRADMIRYIGEEIKKGRQAYFVCPKIEGDEEGELLSVTAVYDELKERLPNVKFALLHGKMKEAIKNETMQDFKDGKIDALVSTTVIEVGVDVPNASIMVIFNADRFGLSQLHQLRGRVGRSNIKSYCFLLSDTDSPEAAERLKVLCDNTDGFKISEYDYKTRGGGDFMGVRQSGKFTNDLGNLKYDVSAIFLAKKISDDFFSGGYDVASLKPYFMSRYERLKDVSLN